MRTWKPRYRGFVIRNSRRERRRAWVTVMYSGLAGWTVSSLLLGLVFSRNNTPLWLSEISSAFFVVGLLLWGFGFAVTLLTSSYVSHGRLIFTGIEPQDRELDERQQATWHRASGRAYLVVLGILLLGHLYWAFVHPLLSLTDKVPMGLFSLAVLLLAVSLPNAIVAWTEPDPEG